MRRKKSEARQGGGEFPAADAELDVQADEIIALRKEQRERNNQK